MYPSNSDRQREYTEIKLTPERVIDKRKRKKKKTKKKYKKCKCVTDKNQTNSKTDNFSTKIKDILFKLSDICFNKMENLESITGAVIQWTAFIRDIFFHTKR